MHDIMCGIHPHAEGVTPAKGAVVVEKIRRNERLCAMMKMLSDAPNRTFTLSAFCDLFGAAKSTMSEDIDILQRVMAAFDLGVVETATGAAGGVKYRPTMSRGKALSFIRGLGESLSGSHRVLPGGYLYYADILSDPAVVKQMGIILATAYYDMKPEFVLTMETKGIPVAMATADALGVPLVIARHASKVYEGSAVNINYVTGSSGRIETMSLSRRAIQGWRTALIVDDFLKGGGTAQGMVDLMGEFGVQVVGMAFVMASHQQEKKLITGEKALMHLSFPPDQPGHALVEPAPWLMQDA